MSGTGPLQLTAGKAWADIFEESEDLAPSFQLRELEDRNGPHPLRDATER